MILGASSPPERPVPASDPVARAEALQALVRSHADQAERERCLPQPVAELFAEAGLYRMAAPAWCGGESADPLTQFRAIEAIAEADGSAGWNLMIGIETFGLIAPGMAACAELIADPAVIMCSSTAAVGRADAVPGGYRVSGQWQFVSGCQNSRVFGATVRLFEDGEPLPDADPLYAMIRHGEFTIVDTWNVSGLRGSGSHDVRVDEVVVPPARMVSAMGPGPKVAPVAGATRTVDPEEAARHRAFQRFPLGPRLAYNKVAVALGIARAAITSFIDLAAGKVPRFSRISLRERGRAQRAVIEAELEVLGARTLVMDLLAALWDDILAGRRVPPWRIAVFQAACSDAVAGACAAVDLLADAAGTTANMIGHPLERLGRDVRVVRQHVTVASHHIDDAGRVLLGLPAEEAMLRGLGARADAPK
jgi:alkylation response protein AidB-like acyl-CoA dehydrogenase